MVGAIADKPTNLKICGKILPILPNGILCGKIPSIYLIRDVMQKLSAYSPILGCYMEIFSPIIVRLLENLVGIISCQHSAKVLQEHLARMNKLNYAII